MALQEIWQIPYPETVAIPGYKFISKQQAKNNGGGLAFTSCRLFLLKFLPPVSENFVETCIAVIENSALYIFPSHKIIV
jgi:hypothetical protein